MAFDNPTNRGRSLKIVDTLAHMEKSATSNGASAAEIADMCAPVINMLRQIGALPPESASAPAGSTPEGAQGIDPAQGPADAPSPASAAVTADDMRGLSPGRRAALMMADQCSLRELMAALAGRLDAHGERLDGLVDLKRQQDAVALPETSNEAGA